jgi:hypothetical protein
MSGVNLAAAAGCRLRQAPQIEAPVGFCEEAGRAVVSALDDVMGDAGQFESRWPGHRRSTRQAMKGYTAASGRGAEAVVTGKLL